MANTLSREGPDDELGSGSHQLMLPSAEWPQFVVSFTKKPIHGLTMRGELARDQGIAAQMRQRLVAKPRTAIQR